GVAHLGQHVAVLPAPRDRLGRGLGADLGAVPCHQRPAHDRTDAVEQVSGPRPHHGDLRGASAFVVHRPYRALSATNRLTCDGATWTRHRATAPRGATSTCSARADDARMFGWAYGRRLGSAVCDGVRAARARPPRAQPPTDG